MGKDLFDLVYDLLDYVAIKYGVTSYDEFTCKQIRALAEEIKYFEIAPIE